MIGIRQMASRLDVPLAVALVTLTIGAAPATAEEITSFSVSTSTSQAGGHPDVVLDSTFTNGGGGLSGGNPTDARRIITRMPTGFIGTPHAIPTCSLVAFALNECSPSSQVGIAAVDALTIVAAPIYNMETKPDQAGLIAFNVQTGGTVQFIELSARTDSDYGLDSVSSPIFHSKAIGVLTVELWGVPADPSHDEWRFKPPVSQDCSYANGCSEAVGGAESSAPPEPYLQNPTACGVALEAKLEIEYYSGKVASAGAPWPQTTDCDQLSFNPSLTVKPTTAAGDTASGLDANLKVPQILNPYSPSPSQIRGVKVKLPEGFSINPSAADGKLACQDEQTSIGTLLPAACPEHAKVGTLQIDSSALPGPIPGAIYLGEPKPDDPYPLILAASGFATHVKLRASTVTDPSTGRVEVVFDDLPQSPLTEFDMHFFGSERGLLATPTKCGEFPVVAEFEPWNSALPNQSSTSFFNVSGGPNGTPCPSGARPLRPAFNAGSLNPTAGRYTPFNLEVVRGDGEQNLAGLAISTPLGFSGALRGIAYCPEAALARLAAGGGSGVIERAEPSCPFESQIGTATAGAGAGSRPLHTPGKVYLAGPYKGAPLSLAVVIPAVSGPYDLGNVAVRAAIYVDRITARVTAISDPLPQILEGIPLRTRSIRVELDRPDFAVNPTNCDSLSTDARIAGTEGAVAAIGSHYQVANCSILPFEPKLSFRMRGGMKRTGHPTLIANLRAPEGQANLARTGVLLPKSQILDNANIQAPCTRVQFAANSCPPGSVIGHARAWSPLIDAPLEGPVYLRVSNNRLPDLVADLKGQIDIEVSARIDSVKERIRTTFTAIPDVPVTRFALTLRGGKRGLLFNNQNLCRSRQFANAFMRGQNGAVDRGRKRIKLSCGKRRKASAKRHMRSGKAG